MTKYSLRVMKRRSYFENQRHPI